MRSNNTQGFSLIELMVVVGIISILAFVATPVYNSYVFKSRQVEAKASLAGIFTAQKAFYAQYGAYHSSFQAVGFVPEGFVHFNVGFGDIGTVAGPAQGFDLVVDPDQISSQSHCGGALGANVPGNNCSLVHETPALDAVLTVYPSAFAAGAVINRSYYVDNRELPGGPVQVAANNSFLQIVLSAVLVPAYAVGHSTQPGWIVIPPLEPWGELWVIDHTKTIYQARAD